MTTTTEPSDMTTPALVREYTRLRVQAAVRRAADPQAALTRNQDKRLATIVDELIRREVLD